LGKENSRQFMISSAINELGTIFRYGNLIYWATINNIPVEEIKNELKEIIKKGLARVTLEIRCPKCGAHLGNFDDLNKVPLELICTDCGKHWRKTINLHESIELVIELTEKGIQFFRHKSLSYQNREKEGSIKQSLAFIFRVS